MPQALGTFPNTGQPTDLAFGVSWLRRFDQARRFHAGAYLVIEVPTRQRLTLTQFLWDAFTYHSLKGWRGIRPTRREVVAAVAFTAIAVYCIVVILAVGAHTHCLWDRNGPKCDGGLINRH